MSFQIPTLKELSDRCRSAFRAELPGTDATVWPSFLYVCSKVIAAMVYMPFKRLQWVIRQAFVSTAEGIWLERHGSDFGIVRKSASFAGGTVDISAGADISIPNGSIGRIDGVAYEVISGATIAVGGTGTIEVRATDAGASGNASPGDAMTFDLGGSYTAVVGALGLVGGADTEDDESLRERILFRLRNPPHCGTPADYVRWSREVPGVSRAFVDRLIHGPGTVGIYIMMDGLYPNGIPPQGALDLVSAHFDDVAPAGAERYVLAPVAHVVDVDISDMVPNTPQVQEAVIDDLSEMFFRRSRVSMTSDPFTFSRSWVWQTVANTTGEEEHNLNAPRANIACANGEIPVIGSVTFH